MTVQELQLIQVRSLEEVELEFHPGMNLIVGVNGAGKSTVLDALRVVLSNVIVDLTRETRWARREGFEERDIAFGRDFLQVKARCTFAGTPFTFIAHRTFEDSAPSSQGEGQVRQQTHETPDRDVYRSAEAGIPVDDEALRKIARFSGEVPLAVYFGPERSVISRKRSSGNSAYADALRSRPLQVREFADWWRVREQFASEGLANADAQLSALETAVTGFLGGYRNLRAEERDTDGYTLVMDKGETTLDVGQLSDGERGVVALVLDLTRRLALAYPKLEEPSKHGEAVVLIDEIDLHLHPGWQREVVLRLTETFPECQFICTTHSPQAISEVGPERVQYLVKDEDGVRVVRRSQSYGLDSNWILEFLMGAKPRPQETEDLAEEIEDAIDRDDLTTARQKLEELKAAVGGDSEEIARLEGSLIAFEALAEPDADEDEADEDDPEA